MQGEVSPFMDLEVIAYDCLFINTVSKSQDMLLIICNYLC